MCFLSMTVSHPAPRFGDGMELFDSHAHYDDPAFDADREELLSSYLPKSGVAGIINAGTSVASSRRCLELAARYPYLYAAAGIHPEESEDAQPGDVEKIGELVKNSHSIVAIGEIGLDYHYEGAGRELQLRLFEEQLMLANDLHLPVILHDRDAHADMFRLIQKHRPRGVLHCFSGSAESAREYVKLGLYFGFTGSVTFKNNRKAPEVLAVLPRDRILIETDCPHMAPEPLRGRRCDSSMLLHTVERVAQYIGLTPDEAAALTARNVRNLFGIMNPAGGIA